MNDIEYIHGMMRRYGPPGKWVTPYRFEAEFGSIEFAPAKQPFWRRMLPMWQSFIRML